MSDFDYANLIVDIEDYPEPGVVFKDIMPLVSDAKGYAAVINDIASHFSGRGVTKVMGAEARGFLIGAPVAIALGVGFVSARKPGKLPRKVISQSYELEYGTDSLEILADALAPDDVVIIVDDLVATGGTAVAQTKLIEGCGAKLEGMGFLLELEFLNPRALIAEATEAEVFTLVKVE